VAPVYEQANILFEKLQKDEPIVIKKANTGSGAVVDPSASPTTEPTPSETSTATPTPSPTSTDPEWRGTNAATTTCSG
jgi:hypothetical protein